MKVQYLPGLVDLLGERQGLPDTAGVPVPAVRLNSFLMTAPQFPFIEFQGFFLRPLRGVGHVTFSWFFYTVHAAGRSPADEHLAEETAPFLVFQPVDGEYLLAVHVSKAEDSLDFIEPLTELALVEQHHHVRVVDDGFLDDRAADDVLYLLCHHADRSPELTGRLVHKLDVFGHERAGNRLPRFLYDQDFAVLLDTHLL